MRTLVTDIVRDDERLTWDGPFHVGLDQWRAQRRDLSTVAFTVVDLETTGGTPGFTKITEIGAVRLEGGRQVATFSQLVDPRQPVPAKITDITGISAEMLVGQPPIEEVLPRFLAFSADSVLVAHNARFDLGFLDYELSMLMSRTFPRPTLDTLRLARRLLRPMRCSLAALAERFDTAVKPRHRALDDALATAEILLLLLARRAGTGRDDARRGRAPLRARSAAQLPQDRAHRGPADPPGRVHHARRPRPRALHRQGREPAPPGPRPLSAAPGLRRAPGARAPRPLRRARDGLRVRRAAARVAPDRQAPPALQPARHARVELPLRQAHDRPVPAPVRHAEPPRRRRPLRRALPPGELREAPRRPAERRLPAAHLRAPARPRAPTARIPACATTSAPVWARVAAR